MAGEPRCLADRGGPCTPGTSTVAVESITPVNRLRTSSARTRTRLMDRWFGRVEVIGEQRGDTVRAVGAGRGEPVEPATRPPDRLLTELLPL